MVRYRYPVPSRECSTCDSLITNHQTTPLPSEIDDNLGHSFSYTINQPPSLAIWPQVDNRATAIDTAASDEPSLVVGLFP